MFDSVCTVCVVLYVPYIIVSIQLSNNPYIDYIIETMVHKVSDKADFDSQLSTAGTKLVVVDFFATWCGPCKMISPILDKLSQDMAADVLFIKVDVDENEDIAIDNKVTVMPTFVFFKNGQKVDEFSGANENKLKELIAKHK
ncbi:thioredoxin-2-like [Oppia nitens]|uniref:thioredoxin-2-like n=1 Tax=Oppia nitens TaxID=1686743 RepID=UPI0023D9DD3A|nr:thioredoxin-2-like [Oppia nitens]